MTNDYDYWSGRLKSSQEDFAQSKAALESKEHIYNAVMQKIATDNQPVLSFSQAQQKYGDNIQQPKTRVKKEDRIPIKKKSSGQRSAEKRPKNRQKTNNLFRLAPILAAAAVVVFTVVNLNARIKPAVMAQKYYNPPLVVEDMPAAIAAAQVGVRTIAADNDFYLAYEQAETTNEQIDLLLYSRHSKINWKQLFVTDDSNNLITPLYIDEKNSSIVLPTCNTDLMLEVSDENGNDFQCTIPKYL